MISRLAFFVPVTLGILMLSAFIARCQDSSVVASIAMTDSVMRADSIDASDRSWIPYSKEFRKYGRRYSIPPAWLAAITQEESAFKPTAERTEPSYLKNKKVKRAAAAWSKAHHGIPTATTELVDRATSRGLMQPMGEVAREQNFDSLYLVALQEPEPSIEQGAILFRRLLDRYHGDTLSAVSAYNQGNNRKSHGTFDNSRYVFRVVIAHNSYDKVFNSYTHATHVEQSHPLQIARSGSNAPHDSSSLAKPAMPSQADTGSFAHKGNADSGIASTIRHDNSSRYTPGSNLSPSEREPFDSVRFSVALAVGFLFLFACVLGLATPALRFYGGRTGYDFRLPRSENKSLLDRPQISGPYSDKRPSIRSL